jgi:hypothetical protein
MKAATAARLAWALCVACLVGLGASLLLQVLNGTAGLGSTPLPVALTFAVVGALFAVGGRHAVRLASAFEQRAFTSIAVGAG